MTALRLELKDVLFQLRAAQDELRIAITEQDDSEICEEIRRVIGTLQDVILRIQRRKNMKTKMLAALVLLMLNGTAMAADTEIFIRNLSCV